MSTARRVWNRMYASDLGFARSVPSYDFANIPQTEGYMYLILITS